MAQWEVGGGTYVSHSLWAHSTSKHEQCTEKRFTKFSGSVPGGSYSPPLTSQCGGAFLCLTMCYAIIVLKGFVAGSPLTVLNVASQAELSWGAQLHQPGHPQTWVVDLQVRRGVEVGARIGIGCTVSWGKDWSRLHCKQCVFCSKEWGEKTFNSFK